MMRLIDIDSLAVGGRSLAHRTAAPAKLVAVALAIGALAVSSDTLVVAGVLLALLGAAAASALPLRRLVALAAYPALFAALFALAAGAGLRDGILYVLKAASSASVVLLLTFTTPYPQIFAPLQRFMPWLLGDAIFMTYRSLLLLADRFDHALRAAHLRGGIVGRHPLRSARVVATSLASTTLYALDLAQRTYSVMYLRGYEGRVVVGSHAGASRLGAWVALGGAATIALVLGMWAVRGNQLAAYSWIITVIGALALVAAVLTRAMPGRSVR